MKFGCKKQESRIETYPTSLWESPNTSFGNNVVGRFGEIALDKSFYGLKKRDGAAFLLLLRRMYPNWWNRARK